MIAHNGTPTSRAAAESMRGHAATARAKVFECIRSAGIHGRTREEIERETGLSSSTVRPRCVELIERKVIGPSGEIRRTATGRAAEVLVAMLTETQG